MTVVDELGMHPWCPSCGGAINSTGPNEAMAGQWCARDCGWGEMIRGDDEPILENAETVEEFWHE